MTTHYKVPSHRTLISVIMPVRNEATIIKAALSSVLAQNTSQFDIEVLAIDAMSTDGSVDIITELAREDSRLKLVTNERILTPYAFNIGLKEARGDYICTMGAHTTYDDNYIARCFEELKAHEVVGCGGRLLTQPANDTLQAKLSAWAYGHPFGTSTRSVRTHPEGYVDSPAYPVVQKQPMIDVGGYDERLTRNQDNDMSQKLRAAGHKMYCTWKTNAYIYSIPSIDALLRYGFRGGLWNVRSLRANFGSMKLRHFTPALFLTSLIISVLMGAIGVSSSYPFNVLLEMPLILITGSYFTLSTISAVHVAIRERSFGALWLILVFFLFHVAYGAGTLWGFIVGVRSWRGINAQQ